MINPWLEIPFKDYEDHMREVGQLQCLNALVKHYLWKHSPESFALLGCATGNGLEHVRPTTRNAYAIDINPDYLAVVNERFKNHTNIKTIEADIQKDQLPLENIDLIFLALVLEYVDPDKALSNIVDALSRRGTLLIVIQKSKADAFVSNTGYTSLKKLKPISCEVDEEHIGSILRGRNLIKADRRIFEVSEGKSFIALEYTQH